MLQKKYLRIIEFIAVISSAICWFYCYYAPDMSVLSLNLLELRHISFSQAPEFRSSQYPPLLYFMYYYASTLLDSKEPLLLTHYISSVLTAANIAAAYYLAKELSGIRAGILSFIFCAFSVFTFSISGLYVPEIATALFITLFIIVFLRTRFDSNQKLYFILSAFFLGLALLTRPNALIYCFVPIIFYIKHDASKIFSKKVLLSAPVICLFFFIFIFIIFFLKIHITGQLYANYPVIFHYIDKYTYLSPVDDIEIFLFIFSVIWMAISFLAFRKKYPDLALVTSCIYIIAAMCAPYYLLNNNGAEYNWEVYWKWVYYNDPKTTADILSTIYYITLDMIPIAIMFPVSFILCNCFKTKNKNICFLNLIFAQCIAGIIIHAFLRLEEYRFFYPQVSCFAAASAAWFGLKMTYKQSIVASIAALLCITICGQLYTPQRAYFWRELKTIDHYSNIYFMNPHHHENINAKVLTFLKPIMQDNCSQKHKTAAILRSDSELINQFMWTDFNINYESFQFLLRTMGYAATTEELSNINLEKHRIIFTIETPWHTHSEQQQKLFSHLRYIRKLKGKDCVITAYKAP